METLKNPYHEARRTCVVRSQVLRDDRISEALQLFAKLPIHVTLDVILEDPLTQELDEAFGLLRFRDMGALSRRIISKISS